MIFNIDFEKLYRLLLLVFMRKYDTLLAIMQACINPLIALYDNLLAYRGSVAQSMSYSSKTCRLRAMLNDLYDAEQRRITVNNTIVLDYLYIYTAQEGLPVVVSALELDTPTMLNRADVVGGSEDFDVNVPSDIYDDKERIRRIQSSIDNQKITTRNYRIIQQ